MKVSYLIDTDWIIHYLLGTKHIQEELERLRPEGLRSASFPRLKSMKGFTTLKISMPAEKALRIF